MITLARVAMRASMMLVTLLIVIAVNGHPNFPSRGH